MSALAFTNQRDRVRRVVENALNGTTFESSRTEDNGRMVVIQAKRRVGTLVSVRFRAVQKSEATQEPEIGSPVKVVGVSAPSGSFLRSIFPLSILLGAASAYARVRIDAGKTRLDITCQDAEWWEGTAPASESGT